MKKILIIGASGFLGSKIFAYLKSQVDYSVNGTYHKNKLFDELEKFDQTDIKEVKRLMAEEYDIIIHTAGIVNSLFCEKHAELAENIHVGGIKNICRYLPKTSKLVYFSSDYVFDGKKTDGYDEDSIKHPLNVYGMCKSMAEDVVLESDRNLVIRVPLIYGFNKWNNKYMNKFSRKELRIQSNIRTNPIFINDIFENILDLIQYSGIIHLGGPEVITKEQLYSRTARLFKLPSKLIEDDKASKIKVNKPINSIVLSTRHRLKLRLISEAFDIMQRQKRAAE
ncbi:MAG: sugar nucleotide-binding protein [Nanoarchaeota archaeon]|nr:sugar nucleotide-binding protein [Nanoarchaeota archaeon]